MSANRQLSIDRSALLSDPVRRALYDAVSVSTDPVDRDQAAAAAGVSRSLAAFHLDRLASAGLLEVEFQHRGEKRGPGSGRPAKFYRRPQAQSIDLSLPPRRYELAARLMAEALDSGPGSDSDLSLEAAARRAGQRLAQRVRQGDGPPAARVIEVLRDEGYEPRQADGRVLLRNCPFHALVDEHRALTCGMNLALLSGLADGVPEAELVAQRDVEPGFCCVSLHERDS